MLVNTPLKITGTYYDSEVGNYQLKKLTVPSDYESYFICAAMVPLSQNVTTILKINGIIKTEGVDYYVIREGISAHSPSSGVETAGAFVAMFNANAGDVIEIISGTTTFAPTWYCFSVH